MALITVYDATHTNVGSLPKAAPVAGYLSGSADIQWTSNDWTAHPGAVTIDQSPEDGSFTSYADVDDYENGAVLLSELAPRYVTRFTSFLGNDYPGQREPLIYCSRNMVTIVANALIAGGVNSAGLWVADWGIGPALAGSMVTQASGPFPIRGVQYASNPEYDTSVFDERWFNTVATSKVSIDVLPPGEWEFPVVLLGKGIDGNLWETTFDGTKWTTPIKL